MCCYQTSSEMLCIDGFFNSSAGWVVQDNGVKLIGGALVFWWYSAVSDSIYIVERCLLCRHFQATMKNINCDSILYLIYILTNKLKADKCSVNIINITHVLCNVFAICCTNQNTTVLLGSVLIHTFILELYLK